jgi:acyl carrier protein
MRKFTLENFVQSEVAAVLGLAAGDFVPPETGFFDLGMDSLTSVELRRRLESGTGLALPSSLTFSYPNLKSMSDFLASKLGESRDQKVEVQVIPPPPLQTTLADDLTESELESRLLARLQEVR